MRNLLLYISLILSGLGAMIPAASAQSPSPTVAVLGIQSVEGDDTLAQQLSEALRASAKQQNIWRVLDTSASVQQLSLAHDCNALDVTCLSSISRSLGVTKIVFGTLRRTNRSTDYDFFLKLSIFDLASRQIEYTVSNTIERSVADSGNLNQIAGKYMLELSERPKLGAIIIQVQEPANAEVRVDGNLVLSQDGNAIVTANVPPGRHQLVVAAPGYVSFNRSIEIDAGEKTRVSVSLQEQELAETEDASSESSEVNWLGWGAIGLGAVFLGLSTYSFLRVYAIDNDADLDMYRSLPGLEGDVCAAAKDGFTGTSPDPNVDVDRVASLCDEADMLEVLQYVFLAAGVVSVGVGITLLVLDDGDEPSDELEEEYASLKPRLELVPKFGQSYAMLNATLRF